MVSMDENENIESLKDVVRWLTTPAACGVFLSARDLERIGREMEIAGLPANRRFAVEQLFRAASIDGRVGPLFGLLIAEVDAHVRSYQECDSPVLDDWISRAEHASRRLADMRSAWVSESND
jgi:hypothetical protein